MFKNNYPPNWRAIEERVKDEANWRCIRCGAPHGAPPNVLTARHFDGNKANSAWWNLPALCHRCHLSVQARVNQDQPYFFEHTPKNISA